jgi:hypothetical protein
MWDLIRKFLRQVFNELNSFQVSICRDLAKFRFLPGPIAHKQVQGLELERLDLERSGFFLVMVHHG